jgi:predicted nucleic acid-binding protein
MKDTNAKFVLDASYLAAYLLPDEYDPQVTACFEKYISNSLVLIAPSVLDYEILNIIRSAIVQGRLKLEHKDVLVNLYQDLSIQTLPIDYISVLDMSLAYSISAYDASYLWLANHLGISLLTLDAHLASIVVR